MCIVLALMEGQSNDTPGHSSELDHPIDKKTLDGLERDARIYGRRGVAMFTVGVVLGIGVMIVSYLLTSISIEDLNHAEDPSLMLVLLLVRGTFFGALSVGFLFAVFTIATAYIDQSTRFRKRLYSAHMLNYVFITFTNQIKDSTVKMKDVIGVFSAWNENVDSAFSSVRFQREGKDLSFDGRGLRLAVQDPKAKSRKNGRG